MASRITVSVYDWNSYVNQIPLSKCTPYAELYMDEVPQVGSHIALDVDSSLFSKEGRIVRKVLVCYERVAGGVDSGKHLGIFSPKRYIIWL